MKADRYTPQEIEPKWQKKWATDELYKSDLTKENKHYVLAEFAYPSGDLHMGHWFTWGGADIYARFKRMQGFQVFFPNGFDAFGLPAENAAIKRNIDPSKWTHDNIAKMKEQYATMGASFVFDHEIITCEPEYYKWNQWLFLKMFEKGIAYQGKQMANWCPSCQTVLANEGVEAGKCWRCGSEVIQKEVTQWFFKITEYADKLLWSKEPKVDWPKATREAQNNWIGKSEGLLFTAPVKDMDLEIQTFSAHFEACFADTFVVIAPDHPLLDTLIKDQPNQREIKEFANSLVAKRLDDNYTTKEPEGIFTGRYIIDPLGNGDLPIWIANYALKDYGTGIVKCSCHDERDFAFAKKYNIPLKPVLFPKELTEKEKVKNLEVCYTDMKNGILEEPKEFYGKVAGVVRKDIIEYLENKQLATRTTQYHLHDWSISRQRYWGTPIPIIYCDSCGIQPVPEKDLPVVLPTDVDYAPKGKSPLASNEEWMTVDCPKCGKPAKRDADTMDTFVDSSWYFLRFLSPHDDKQMFDTDIAKRMMPVDIYFGGSEHTLGHTLYSRFVTKFIHDLGLLEIDEYAAKRVNHGIVLGPDGNKMSKSKGNVVNPDDEVKKYGADAVRVHVAFFMPYDGTGPWISERIEGAFRFLQRIWNIDETKLQEDIDEDSKHAMNRAIEKCTSDYQEIKFNTAVAALMEWLNALLQHPISKIEYETLLKLLSPIAPHMTEELWSNLGYDSSIHVSKWPEPVVAEAIKKKEIPVQIDGKIRATITIDITDSEEKVSQKVLEIDEVKKWLDGKVPKKVIVVPLKIVSIIR